MTFQQYLDAKRTVDDRALNRRVLRRFQRELCDAAESATPADRVRVLEIGAGIGTMIERLRSWNCLPNQVQYTALDINPENVEMARERLQSGGFERDGDGDELRYERNGQSLTVRFEVAEAVEFAQKTDRQWDALVGHAVADLFDLESAFPAFRSVVDSGGLCYFPITFDGETMFEPAHELDERVTELYHRHMDDGDGSSRAGRRLLAECRNRETELLAVGSSDWVVYPENGSYHADEGIFLRHILGTIAGVLDGHSEIDTEAFSDWLATRHRQVGEGELTYIAHQFDVLAKMV
ncbi:Methyltransferase domain-containing protein [Haladaptatus litoreus]|uniref:Methyltransferase domain-containing protein n=1 Tax=Haladaptatus litoreus TaxID=553468 RepID=A0A1N7E6Q3_9EURY|nr:class I SAM-dependent methyltransferase [Haladaptatus litoreus]SIR83724.1 Methyltransferase domain-containing protein [Haladaptatus litoreus]